MKLFTSINTPLDFLNSSSWLKDKFLTNFGYIEDGPGNDLNFNDSSMSEITISDNLSLKRFFKPISNQLLLGSCTANAVADSFEAQIAQRNKCLPSQVDDISRLFIYWNARNLENPPTCTIDKGSRIRLAFDCMSRYGAPAESIYPYDVSKVNKRPTILSYREAIKNRIDKFYRIDSTGSERIKQIKQALSAGNPVVFGTKVAASFKAVNSDTVVYNPGGGWIGGHAMCIVGWSELKQAFEVRNSWGTSWGVNGYCWMDKNYIASSITSDIWVPTI
jgi:C1A family cysteine protease